MAERKLTQILRERVRLEAEQTGNASVRRMGEMVGVQYATLWRFLSGGSPSARLIDRLYTRYFQGRER